MKWIVTPLVLTALGVTILAITTKPRDVSRHFSRQKMEQREAFLAPLWSKQEKAIAKSDWQTLSNIQDQIDSKYPREKIRGGKIRARVAIAEGDYGSAFKLLELYFYGSKDDPSHMSGDVDAQSWFIALALLNSDESVATKAAKELFSIKIRLPISNEYLDAKAVSPNIKAQLYIYLAAFNCRRLFFDDAAWYFDAAKKMDPNLKVVPELKTEIDEQVKIGPSTHPLLFPRIDFDKLK